MTLTGIDAKPALVVIDPQRGIAAAIPAAHRVDEIVDRAADLAAAFGCQGLPVVPVTMAG